MAKAVQAGLSGHECVKNSHFLFPPLDFPFIRGEIANSNEIKIDTLNKLVYYIGKLS